MKAGVLSQNQRTRESADLTVAVGKVQSPLRLETARSVRLRLRLPATTPVLGRLTGEALLTGLVENA